MCTYYVPVRQTQLPMRQIGYQPDSANPYIIGSRRVGRPRQHWLHNTHALIYTALPGNDNYIGFEHKRLGFCRQRETESFDQRISVYFPSSRALIADAGSCIERRAFEKSRQGKLRALEGCRGAADLAARWLAYLLYLVVPNPHPNDPDTR